MGVLRCLTLNMPPFSFCCAGTPISHGGKSDLLGLLKFLQVPHIPAGEELTAGG